MVGSKSGAGRPTGVKGKYKLVDKRFKTELRAKKIRENKLKRKGKHR